MASSPDLPHYHTRIFTECRHKVHSFDILVWYHRDITKSRIDTLFHWRRIARLSLFRKFYTFCRLPHILPPSHVSLCTGHPLNVACPRAHTVPFSSSFLFFFLFSHSSRQERPSPLHHYHHHFICLHGWNKKCLVNNTMDNLEFNLLYSHPVCCGVLKEIKMKWNHAWHYSFY